MKAFKKLVETAREAQNNLPDKRRIDLLELEIEERVWISQHEAMQFFLNKCSEMNLPTSETTYDRLLKALCKGTESQDEHFLKKCCIASCWEIQTLSSMSICRASMRILSGKLFCASRAVSTSFLKAFIVVFFEVKKSPTSSNTSESGGVVFMP